MLRTSIRKARAARSISEARQDGFTLIELLIVIVVLGILAGIVVFGVATFRADAQTAACNADVKTVSVASDAFIARNGAPAASVAALQAAGYLKTVPVTAVVYTVATGAVAAPAGGC